MSWAPAAVMSQSRWLSAPTGPTHPHSRCESQIQVVHTKPDCTEAELNIAEVLSRPPNVPVSKITAPHYLLLPFLSF